MKFIVLQIKLFAKLESTAERRHKYYSFGWKNRREGTRKKKSQSQSRSQNREIKRAELQKTDDNILIV